MEVYNWRVRATQRFLFGAGLLAFCIAPAVHAAVILSENFNELTQQLDVTSAGAFSTINGTNVDVVGNPGSFPLCNGPESGNCIDMNGSGGNPQGQLQSNMVFAPGSYLLSFDLIGDQRGSTASVTVTLGNYDQIFTLASGDLAGGIVANAPVTVTTPSHLLFASGVLGDLGLELDNVVVSTAGTSTAIPEPSSLLLLGSGLLAGALALRRRKSLSA
jgi:PEP-CTERM motif